MYSHCTALTTPPEHLPVLSDIGLGLWSENNTRFHSKTFWVIYQFSHKNTIVSAVRNEGYDISFLYNSSLQRRTIF